MSSAGASSTLEHSDGNQGLMARLSRDPAVPSSAANQAPAPPSFLQEYHKWLGSGSRPSQALIESQSVQGHGEPCTMHTYFEASGNPVTLAAHESLIANWRTAWEASGWKTRVIKEDDARNHPEYESLRDAFMALPTVGRSTQVSCGAALHFACVT
jgi:hypothetical protein